VRLAALHCEHFKDAFEILFPDGKPSQGSEFDIFEDAIGAFVEVIEEAICRGTSEVTLDLMTAELLALQLKTRTRKRGHPNKSQRQELLRKVTLKTAEDQFAKLRQEGLGIEKSRSIAAKKASARGRQAGDQVAASTIVRQMKEAAAARKKTR